MEISKNYERSMSMIPPNLYSTEHYHFLRFYETIFSAWKGHITNVEKVCKHLIN